MNGFTDIHAHFVYGVDDGAQSLADMEAMLDAAYADGIEFLFATPHVTPGILPFNTRLFQRRLEEARRYCGRMGYPLKLYAGAEVMYTPIMEEYARERRLPTLAGSKYVLMECLPDITLAELDKALGIMDRAGYSTILAHIERYSCMYYGNAHRLKEKHDVRYQVNCNTILCKRGFFKDRAIENWLKEELIDFLASDSHDTVKRKSRMSQAYELLCRRKYQSYADQLFGRIAPQIHG